MWVILFIIFLVAMLQIIFPTQMLMFRSRLQLRGWVRTVEEPSEPAVFMARLWGIFGIVALLLIIVAK